MHWVPAAMPHGGMTLERGHDLTIFLKDPSAAVDYGVDWSAGYLVGRTIGSSTWRVSPDGAGAIVVEATQIALQRTVVTLSGGQPGCVYQITNAVVFSDGRRDERMLLLRVEDR